MTPPLQPGPARHAEAVTGPPTQPGSPGFGGSGPAPVRSSRSMFITVLIAVVLIGGGLSTWLLVTPSADRSTPRGAAEAFAVAWNDRNLEDLTEVTCADDRGSISSGGAMMIQAMQLGTLRLDSVDVDVDDDRGSAQFTLVTNLGSLRSSAVLEQESSGDLWSVCLPDIDQLR